MPMLRVVASRILGADVASSGVAESWICMGDGGSGLGGEVVLSFGFRPSLVLRRRFVLRLPVAGRGHSGNAGLSLVRA